MLELAVLEIKILTLQRAFEQVRRHGEVAHLHKDGGDKEEANRTTWIAIEIIVVGAESLLKVLLVVCFTTGRQDGIIDLDLSFGWNGIVCHKHLQKWEEDGSAPALADFVFLRVFPLAGKLTDVYANG